MNIQNDAHIENLTQSMDTLLIKNDGQKEKSRAEVVREHFLDMVVNEQLAARLVCTPDNLPELVVGRLITDLTITSVDDVESIYLCENGSRAQVFLRENRRYLKKLTPTEWKQEWIFELANSFANGMMLHKATKGTHCCYLSVKGEVVYAVEDIGRHNAVDKAVGYAALQGYCMQDCILYTSGRVPTDMVQKSVAAGIPVLVSKAVPTEAAVEMAKEYHLTLICRAWPDSFEVYA